jgi:hypothetical protein
MKKPTKSIVGILTALPLLLCLACSWPFGPMRTTTFPPDLSYIPAERIKTAMWVLAAEIGHLEKLLGTPVGGSSAFKKAEVRNSLERMRVAAKTLDQPGRSNQHPILNQNLDRFLVRLERAKRAVDRDPPNFFQASTVAGSCYLCHGQSHGTARWSAPFESPEI